MATRKQRKRSQKERRHEYETVWIDPATGEELDEPPEDAPARAPRETKSKPEQKRPQQRSSRALREPLPPSWRRASKRAVMLGAVIFALFAILQKGGKSGYVSALLLAIMYTALFIPFTYYVDRFAYRRWERRVAEQPKKR